MLSKSISFLWLNVVVELRILVTESSVPHSFPPWYKTFSAMYHTKPCHQLATPCCNQPPIPADVLPSVTRWERSYPALTHTWNSSTQGMTRNIFSLDKTSLSSELPPLWVKSLSSAHRLFSHIGSMVGDNKYSRFFVLNVLIVHSQITALLSVQTLIRQLQMLCHGVRSAV